MNYWLNIHWPPLQQHKPDPPSPLPDPEYHYRVYLPNGRQDAGQELRKGDHIFIYETKTGRARKDGKKYSGGRQGIIALVWALTPILPADVDPDEYLDGSIILWKWQARTQVKELGFCSHDDVCRILGYNKEWTFRGFGDQHSGLRRLGKREFKSLLRAFRESP